MKDPINAVVEFGASLADVADALDEVRVRRTFVPAEVKWQATPEQDTGKFLNKIRTHLNRNPHQRIAVGLFSTSASELFPHAIAGNHVGIAFDIGNKNTMHDASEAPKEYDAFRDYLRSTGHPNVNRGKVFRVHHDLFNPHKVKEHKQVMGFLKDYAHRIDYIGGNPPCTNLAISGARWFKQKAKESGGEYIKGVSHPKDYPLQAGLHHVKGVYKLWKVLSKKAGRSIPLTIENPVGRMQWDKPLWNRLTSLGVQYYSPHQHAGMLEGGKCRTCGRADTTPTCPAHKERYTKTTMIAGNIGQMPKTDLGPHPNTKVSQQIHMMSPGPSRAGKRSVSPKGASLTLAFMTNPSLRGRIDSYLNFLHQRPVQHASFLRRTEGSESLIDDLLLEQYVDSIERETESNTNFRKVVFTGKHEQLVVMSLKPGEEIGMETHPGTDQFFRIERGRAKFVINGRTSTLASGGGVVVPAGSKHNVINASNSEPLKLYTIYSPPKHPPNTVQRTKPTTKG